MPDHLHDQTMVKFGSGDMCMKPRVYVETTVVSYLTARPSRDVVVAGRQQVTRDWWRGAGRRFELVVSQLVFEEAGAGDAEAARERLAALEQATVLDASDEAVELGRLLVRTGTVPRVAAQDAVHVALAVVNGVDYLVTWNLRHIANAVVRPEIERICRQAGFEPAVICTPDELMEDYDATGL